MWEMCVWEENDDNDEQQNEHKKPYFRRSL